MQERRVQNVQDIILTTWSPDSMYANIFERGKILIKHGHLG